MPDVVCMGEVMVEFNAVTRGPLRNVVLFEKHAAGAEGNVAIGISRLGVTAGIITRVGKDEFGDFLVSTLKGENVDTSHVAVDAQEAPTGVFFIQRGFPIPFKSESFYFRHNSAASKLSLQDVDSNYISSAKIFHVTGVTPSLSVTAKEATIKAIETAESNNVSVSLDTNVRLKLWNEQAARKTLKPLCEKANIVFTSPSDAQIILGEEDPMAIARLLHEEGVRTVIVKLGERGAFASSEDETVIQPQISANIEDPTGAGESFASTFLATQLKGLETEREYAGRCNHSRARRRCPRRLREYSGYARLERMHGL